MTFMTFTLSTEIFYNDLQKRKRVMFWLKCNSKSWRCFCRNL